MVKKYIIVGVDEAGRGPLAGPVVAAAVIIEEDLLPEYINDSKRLSRDKREKLYLIIKDKASECGVGIVSPKEIDMINIHNANLLAMKKACKGIKEDKKHIFYIDGIFSPKIKGIVKCVKHGDALIPAVSAASIIAKVTRDKIMEDIDKDYPMYNFKNNKGYPTKEHISCLEKYGPCEHHRKTFKPILQS